MSAPAAYGDWLKQELGSLIDALELPDLQKHFLRSRWLDQVAWMEGKANGARKQYNALRLTTIIGGVVIPVLVGLNVTNEPAAAAVRWGTVALSLLVAISAAVEEFFRYGERWQHYRRTAELLKMEGWHFFQLSGPYRRFDSHAEAYRAFAARVEDIIQPSVEVYFTEVASEKAERPEDKEAHAGTAVLEESRRQGG